MDPSWVTKTHQLKTKDIPQVETMKSVLFLVFVVQLAALCVNAQALSVNAQRFDFFYFVQQWPETYCIKNGRCCAPKGWKAARRPENDFYIHGLWPKYNNRPGPSDCDAGSGLNPREINALKKDLRTSWPSFDCRSSDGYSFWEHKWKKHGTCSESVPNQRSYFNKTLALKRRVNLLRALLREGIQPANGRSYSLQNIIKAIEKGTGFTPGITCHQSQLYEIYLCVHRSEFNFIRCPVFPTSTCGSRIGFPSFGVWRHEEPDFPTQEMELKDLISTLMNK